MSDEELIRELIEARLLAMRSRDGIAAVSMLAPNIVAFEVSEPLRVPSTWAADADAMRSWFDSWDGPIDTEVRDLTVHVSGDVAFCHSLNRLTGTLRSGRMVDFWMRSTLGLRKQDGTWRIVHGHTSVPLREDGSLRAAMDLQP
jgi:ketosteroid isomerase-like protein